METSSYAAMATRMGWPLACMAPPWQDFRDLCHFLPIPVSRTLGTMRAKGQVTVHRFEAGLFPVNAYLVETRTGVVVVDATLGVSDGRAICSRVEALGKPLAAVVVTHSHPDHYGGVAALLEGTEVPIYAVDGVNAVIRRDDAAKEQVLRPMFGNEWAAARKFPNRVVRDGERMELGDAVFAVTDLGPGESPHDSLWILESDGPPQAFVGDLVYSHMHPFLADGFYDRWLVNIERAKRELPDDTTLFMGHGQPSTGHAILEWQANYIERFIDVLRSSVENDGLQGDALADSVTAQMKAFLPTEDLLFLLRLSVEPMRARLGLHPR
jgi:glyoxylase-like metal-dependent hydrolase (beta-lactamase superfamily II)